MDIQTIRRYKRNYSLLSGILSNNPILMQGLVLAPAVVASTTLKNGLALCICAFVVFLPTLFVVSFIKGKNQIPHFLRMFFYALLSSVFFIPAAFLTKAVFPSSVDMLGIYMPLLVVNTIVIARAEAVAVRSRPLVAVGDAFFHMIGFAVPVLLAAGIREYFSSGTLYGVLIDLNSRNLTQVNLPFVGFILFGLMAAGAQLISQKATPAYRKWVNKRIILKASAESTAEQQSRNSEER